MRLKINILLKEGFLMKAVISIFFMLLCSCSTISYEEPQDGDRARVRLVTDSESITVIRSYTNDSCENESELMRLKNGFLVNSSPKLLNMPLWDYHKNAAKEFYFEANEEHYLMFFGAETIGTTTYSCAVPTAVKFEPDKDYELSYRFGLSSCFVELSELVKSGTGFSKKEINTYSNIGTDGCASALKRSRWY